MVNSQIYTYPHSVTRIVLAARQAYKDLISYSIIPRPAGGSYSTVIPDTQDNDNRISEGQALDHSTVLPNTQDDDINGILDDPEDNAISDLLFTILEIIIVKPQRKIKKTRGRKPNLNKYEKLLKLPNFYVGLYFPN